MTEWQDIETASCKPIAPGWTVGPLVYLLIPYAPEPDWTVGRWNVGWAGVEGYWEHIGQDGPHDIQPTHWMPLPAPLPAPLEQKEEG